MTARVKIRHISDTSFEHPFTIPADEVEEFIENALKNGVRIKAKDYHKRNVQPDGAKNLTERDFILWPAHAIGKIEVWYA